jgi:hypothetical protein
MSREKCQQTFFVDIDVCIMLQLQIAIEIGNHVSSGNGNAPLPSASFFQNERDPPAYAQAIAGFRTACRASITNSNWKFCASCGQSLNINTV